MHYAYVFCKKKKEKDKARKKHKNLSRKLSSTETQQNDIIKTNLLRPHFIILPG